MINFLRIYSSRISMAIFVLGAMCSFVFRPYIFAVGLSPFKVGIYVGVACVLIILLFRLALQLFANEAFSDVRVNRYDLMAAEDFAKVNPRVKLVLAFQAIGLLTAFFAFGWISLMLFIAI